MKRIIFYCLPFLLPLTAGAQLQNADFEIWDNAAANEEFPFQNKPTGWTIGNGIVFSEDTNLYYPPAADAQNGDYALRLGIWYNYTKDIAFQVAPIASRPSALSGYYKYTDNRVLGNGPDLIDDSASATVYLTKWNNALAKNDTIGRGEVFLNASKDYTAFKCPIVYTGNEVPDTIEVILDCSLMRRQAIFAPNGYASIFTVDNLKLGKEQLGNEGVVPLKTIKIYPNPAKDRVTIADFTGNVLVYDTAGKLVAAQEVSSQNGLQVHSFQSGLYLLQLNDGVRVHHLKLIKE